MLYLVVDAQGVFSVQPDRIGKVAVGVLPRVRSCHGCQALVVYKSTRPAVAFAVAVAVQAWPVAEGLQVEVTRRTTKCIALRRRF
jgi:hypothetical protein